MKGEMINNMGIIVKWNTVSIMDLEKIEAQLNYLVNTIPDKANSTITIKDSGVGMMKNEMINNLGIIA
eukprot:14022214-Heterocapsa_arctica.AAC.1